MLSPFRREGVAQGLLIARNACEITVGVRVGVSDVQALEIRTCNYWPIWLILPVVICFFQGLSHANVSGLGVSRGDCVRLIKRLIVYPTKGAFVLSEGITALTGQLIPGRQILGHPTSVQVKLGRGVKDAIGRNKDQRLHRQM